MKRFSAIIAGAAALALVLAGCGSTNTGDNEYGVIKAGELQMCADVPYEPFEYEDPESPLGYTGFDVDLMSAIAESLGLKLVVVVTDFSALQSGAALAAGNCDVGASAITITEERKANLDYSDPYYDSLQSLLVKKGSNIHKLSDMENMTIGVQRDTTGETYTQDNAPASAEIVFFPTDGEMWAAIQAGQVDALLQDFPINHQHEVLDSGYVVVEKYFTDEQYGFAVAKDKNPELLAAVNDALAAMKEDGTYQEIYDKYFA